MGARRRGADLSIPWWMAATLIMAGPYALALIFYGLRGIAGATRPKALGVSYSADTTGAYLDLPSLVIATSVALIGVGLVVSLVLASKGIAGTRWVVLVWLVLAVAAVGLGARNPGVDRRCFFSNYREENICAPARTIVIRDFALRSTPAVVAIGCLVFGGVASRPSRPDDTDDGLSSAKHS